MNRREAGEDSLAVRVGGRLRERRRARGLTLAALSRSCGVSVSYLSAVENGVNHPSLRILATITEALDMSFPEVLTHEGQETIRRCRVPEEAPETAEISHALLTLRGCVVSAVPGEHGTCPVDLEGRSLFLYVIAGTLLVRVHRTEYALDAGDAMDAAEPRELSWHSPAASTACWVSCPSRWD